jgi:peptide/nickel transport system substrate-binding protein
LIDPRPLCGLLRLNHLHPPFNDKKIRQAMLAAVVQADYMSAIVGPDPAGFRDNVGVFTPDTPMANAVGMEKLLAPRGVERARAMLKESGYAGQLMRLIGPTDILAPAAMTQVAADMFRQIGMNMDFALSDWGTVIQRRNSVEPVEKGGWSALCTSSASFDFVDPAVNNFIRGNGRAAWPGWPSIPEIEALRERWFVAPTLAGQQAIAAEIQRVALDEVAYVPTGAYFSRTALRRNLVDRVAGIMILWGMKRG